MSSSIDDIIDVVVVLDEEVRATNTNSLIPAVETDTRRMFAIAGLSPYKNPFLKYTIPVTVNSILAIAIFSPLWYPDYYIHQTAIWTAHLILVIPCYNYILSQRHKWTSATFKDHTRIRPLYRAITLTFYILFMTYYTYFAAYMFYFNRAAQWPFQLGNALMAAAWYLFFSISSATFYFTATAFLQKAHYIKQAVKTLKISTHIHADFYNMYDVQFKSLRRFNNTWNRIIFIVIVVLAANIPIDTIAVFVRKAYFDLPGILIKFAALLWYLVAICKLNHMETYIVNYLHKHHYLQDSMAEIENYIRVRPIGLNFFGIKITFDYLAKLLIIAVNLLLPTLYGLFENNIL